MTHLEATLLLASKECSQRKRVRGHNKKRIEQARVCPERKQFSEAYKRYFEKKAREEILKKDGITQTEQVSPTKQLGATVKTYHKKIDTSLNPAGWSAANKSIMPVAGFKK